jgi:uncharacterized protein involved in type VI secretion and phage assembly
VNDVPADRWRKSWKTSRNGWPWTRPDCWQPCLAAAPYPEGSNEDVLLPQRISGSEAICGGLEYRILCVATEAQLPLKQFIAVPAELQIVTDRGQLRTVCGIVAEACAGQSDGGLATISWYCATALP